jgi:hypothetical protein
LSKHSSDLEFAAAIIRDGEHRAAATKPAPPRGDIEMPSLVPRNSETPEEHADAQRLQSDLFAVMCLFEKLSAAQRGHLIAYLSRLVETEVCVIPEVKFP